MARNRGNRRNRRGLLGKGLNVAGRRYSSKDLQDPSKLSGAQYNTNLQTAAREADLNRLNQSGPLGSFQYGVDENGRPSLKTSLSKEQQGMQDFAFNGLFPQVQKSFSQPLDFNGITQVPGEGDIMGYRQQMADKQYQDFLRQSEPGFKQQQSDFEQRLADRGISPGTEQYNREYSRLQQAQNDARTGAQAQSYRTGGDLADQLFNQGVTGRRQGITERLGLRSNPYSEFASVLGSIQGPQYQQVPQINIADTDVGGIGLGFKGYQNQKDIANIQAQTALQQSQMQGDFGLQGQELQNQGGANVANINAASDLANVNASKPPKQNPFAPIWGAIGQGAGAAIGSGLFGNIFG